MNWRPINTAPRDGSEILLLTAVGITQARFSAGEWHEHHEYGRQYDGPMWICCDDNWEIEIEELLEGDNLIYRDGIASHWQSLPEPPQ